jgi:hypothetical protein
VGLAMASNMMMQDALQERDGEVAIRRNLLVPSGCRVRRWITPRIVVEGKEVASDGVGTAVQVCGDLVTVALDISSRVTNRNRAISTSSDISLHITTNSLDVRSSESGVITVDNLVGRVEKKGIIVLREGVNGGEDALEVDVVVGHGNGSIVQAVEGVKGCVDVQCKVNAGVGQCFHASVVVGRIVD